MLQHTLGLSVEVTSAGTYARVGEGIAEPMAALLQEQGVNNSHFVARQLTEDHVRHANLVLAMTRDHRKATVEVWPAAVRHAFTLREFVRLLQAVDESELPDGDSAMRLAAAVPLATAQRHQQHQPVELDDVADPYRRSAADYLAAYAEIEEAVSSIGASVTGVTAPAARAVPPDGPVLQSPLAG